jgi:hypothetical protein
MFLKYLNFWCTREIIVIFMSYGKLELSNILKTCDEQFCFVCLRTPVVLATKLFEFQSLFMFVLFMCCSLLIVLRSGDIFGILNFCVMLPVYR